MKDFLYIICMGNKEKSTFLNKHRAINRKVSDYLFNNKLIPNTYGLKQNEMYRLFLNELDEEVPEGMKIRDYIHNLYENREYSFLQSIMSRPDIPPSVWKGLKKRVFETYGKQCLCCGSTEFITVDHIKPYSRFPELCIEFDNLQPLCRSCNSRKGNRIIVDYKKVQIP